MWRAWQVLSASNTFWPNSGTGKLPRQLSFALKVWKYRDSVPWRNVTYIYVEIVILWRCCRAGIEVAEMGERVSVLTRGTYYLLTSSTQPFSLQPTNSSNCNMLSWCCAFILFWQGGTYYLLTSEEVGREFSEKVPVYLLTSSPPHLLTSSPQQLHLVPLQWHLRVLHISISV